MSTKNMYPAEADQVCELSPAAFSRLARFTTCKLGIKMPESKLTMAQSRLLRRVRDLGLKSIDEYSDYLFGASHAEEQEQFINAITTNKTDFFREPSHFEFLTRTALPSLAGAGTGRSGWHLTAWSAGCSSGEEPYTVAMVLSEYAAKMPGFEFTILGTDVSTRMLDQARSGIYHESQIAPVPEGLRRRYVWQGRNRSESLVRIVPDLRQRIRFHRLNFMDEDYGLKESFGVIFFRNVMIYFERATQEAVVRRICRNLAPGGYLFVSHSESLAGLDIPVRSVESSVFQMPLQ